MIHIICTNILDVIIINHDSGGATRRFFDGPSSLSPFASEVLCPIAGAFILASLFEGNVLVFFFFTITPFSPAFAPMGRLVTGTLGFGGADNVTDLLAFVEDIGGFSGRVLFAATALSTQLS